MYGQAQAAVQQAQSRGARHRGLVGEGGGEDPRPPGHILPNGLGQEPEVEVVTVTDDDVAAGLEATVRTASAALAADPPGEGHTAARAPHLRLQLLVQTLEIAIVRTHQAHPGPVKGTQELGQAPGLVGAAGHRAEEGWEPEAVREPGMLRSVDDPREERGLRIPGGNAPQSPCSVSTNVLLGHQVTWPHSSSLCLLLLETFILTYKKPCIINVYNLMCVEMRIHL